MAMSAASEIMQLAAAKLPPATSRTQSYRSSNTGQSKAVNKKIRNNFMFLLISASVYLVFFSRATGTPGCVKSAKRKSFRISETVFGRPFVKRFVLSNQTVVLSVCNVGVLWPNGWMDQDETWQGSRPQPRSHCVRWGPSPSPPKKGHSSPLFSARIYCGQTVTHLS